MSLLNQAKTLSKRQIALTTALIEQTRYPTRNVVIFLLSVKAGLRAKEIASLTWDMLTDAEGNLGSSIHLRDEASKGRSGRVIPLNKDLKVALQKLHDSRSPLPYGITTEQAQRTSPAAIVNLFAHWYRPVSMGVRATQVDGRSSPMPHAPYRQSAARFEMFRCSLDIARYRRRSDTSKLMLQRKGASWIWSDLANRRLQFIDRLCRVCGRGPVLAGN